MPAVLAGLWSCGAYLSILRNSRQLVRLLGSRRGTRRGTALAACLLAGLLLLEDGAHKLALVCLALALDLEVLLLGGLLGRGLDRGDKRLCGLAPLGRR